MVMLHLLYVQSKGLISEPGFYAAGLKSVRVPLEWPSLLGAVLRSNCYLPFSTFSNIEAGSRVKNEN